MKFMKLGSRPDTFYTTEAIRSVSTEVSSDLIVQIKGSRYLLHKFPLLSKCLRLQRICSQNLLEAASQHQMVQLPDFPGGVEAFELCAKFCYGITVTLSAYNIVAARCAAEYLQMTEDVEKGNLIYKIEVFFNSCILHGWKDSIVTLQCTKAFPMWSEDLGITSRCIDAVASKVLENPTKTNPGLSHSHSRRGNDAVSCNGHKPSSSTKVWWAEDLAELNIDLYWRSIIAIKAGGKVPANLIGDALRLYASRWLPNAPRKQSESDDSATAIAIATTDGNSKNRLLLESIISLLPSEKGSVSCSFLLKLLKAANILNASSSSKMELARRVGLQFEEANFHDLLIPSSSVSNKHEMMYDVDIVISILEYFLLQGQSPPTSPTRIKDGFERRRRSRSAENAEFEFQESRRSSSSSHSSKLRVTRIVDRYLQQIVRDPNLPLTKFIALAEAVPDFARLDHDDLYKAIDIYLKEHPSLNKSERKRLCRMLDCKKLSMDVCMHAAQNELLPLRVVVQVLFFEQARAAMGSATSGQMNELPSNIKALLAAHGNSHQSKTKGSLSTNATVAPDDQWSVSGLKSPKSSMSTLRMKLEEDEEKELEESFGKSSSRIKALICAIPPRPKKILGKLWSMNRSSTTTTASEKN